MASKTKRLSYLQIGRSLSFRPALARALASLRCSRFVLPGASLERRRQRRRRPSGFNYRLCEFCALARVAAAILRQRQSEKQTDATQTDQAKPTNRNRYHLSDTLPANRRKESDGADSVRKVEERKTNHRRRRRTLFKNNRSPNGRSGFSLWSWSLLRLLGAKWRRRRSTSSNNKPESSGFSAHSSGKLNYVDVCARECSAGQSSSARRHRRGHQRNFYDGHCCRCYLLCRDFSLLSARSYSSRCRRKLLAGMPAKLPVSTANSNNNTVPVRCL